MTAEEMTQEVLILALDTALPRLAVCTVALGYPDVARSVMSLQSEILGVLRPSRRRRRAKK